MTKKSKYVEDHLESIAKRLFKRGRAQAKAERICVFCGGDASSFKDDLSEREYEISRLCQKCQDSVFNEEES